MPGKLEFHYSANLYHLRESFLREHPEFLEQDGKSLYVVNSPARSQFLRTRHHLTNNGATSTRYTFTTHNRFIQDLGDQLSIPQKFLTFVERSFILKNIMMEANPGLQYFEFPEGTVPDETVRKLVNFFDSTRLSLAEQELTRGEENRLALSSSDKLSSDLGLIFAEYCDAMENFYLDEAGLFREIMKRADKNFFRNYYPRLTTIAFEDISSSRKLHLNFFEWLEKMGFSVFLLANYGRNRELFGHREPLFMRMKQMASHVQGHFDDGKLSDSLFQIKAAKIPFEGKIRVVPASHRIAEVEQLAAEIKKQVTDHQLNSATVCVTSPQLESYLPLIETVFRRNKIPFQYYQNLKLINSAVIQMLEILIRTVRDEYPLEGLLKILRTPFFSYHKKFSDYSYLQKFSSLRVKSGRKNILAFLKRENEIHGMSWDEETGTDESGTATLLERVISGFFRDIHFLESAHTADSLYTHFTGFLKKQQIFSWSESDASGAEILRIRSNMAALNRLLELLHSWKEYMKRTAPHRKISCVEFYEFFSFLIRSAHFPGSEFLETGVKIVSLPEVADHEFSAIFVLGMEESVFPSRTNAHFTHPFNLPPALQALIPDDQLLQDRELFLQLLQNRADLLWFSFAKFHKDQPILRSIFLRELQRISRDPLDETTLPGLASHAGLMRLASEKSADGRIRHSDLSDEWKKFITADETRRHNHSLSVIRNREQGIDITRWEGNLTENTLISGWFSRIFSGTSFSPTQLEVYAGCPMIFYLDRIIRIGPEEKLEEFLSPLERGSLVHSVLFKFFYENEPGQRNEEKLLSIAAEEFDRIALPGGFIRELQKEFYLGNEDNAGLFRAFWEIEKEQMETFPSSPLHFELSFGRQIQPGDQVDAASSQNPYVFTEGREKYAFRGKIDRIEASEDGSILIVDYKTGNIPTLRDMWEGQRLQLPVYLRAALEMLQKQNPAVRMGGGAFYQLKNEKEIGKKVVFADREGPFQPPLITEYGRFPGGKYTVDDKPLTLQEFTDRVLQFAAGYIRGIRNGRFMHTTDKKQCIGWNGRICDYFSVCRVNWAKQERIRRKNLISS